MSPMALWLAAAVLIYADTLQAEVYKWVDDDGRIHYSDRPGAQARQLNIDIEPAVGDAGIDRKEKRQRYLDAVAKERADKEQKAQEEKQRKAEQQRRCLFAKDRLYRLRRAGYLYDLDQSGERVVLTDSERETAIQDFEKNIQRYCE